MSTTTTTKTTHGAGTAGGARRRRRGRRAGPAGLVASLAAVVLALGGLGVVAGAASAEPVPVGSGGYTTDRVGPSPEGCAPLASDPRAYLTDDAPDGAIPTNDWWSSLVFKRWNCVGSEPLHAHPVSYQPTEAGLGLSSTRDPVLSGTPGGVGEFHYPYAQDVLVGVAGLAAPVVEVAGWTDWTVTPSWDDGARSMRATIGHGLPFSWYRLSGGQAQLTVTGEPRVWQQDGPVIGFTANGHDYAAFAPSGAAWTVSGTTLVSDLAGLGYLSVASLPTSAESDDATRQAALAQYAPYAYAEVTGAQADYAYDEAAGSVSTTYAVQTTPLEGSAQGTVLALYPHQQQHLASVAGQATPALAAYPSPRGDMTAYVGATAFTTETPYTGVLPELPAVATGSGDAAARLDALLTEAAADPMQQVSPDTYWTGKGLGRAARIAEIADLTGRVDVRDAALAQIRATLTDWFTATPGKTEQVFAYDDRWGTLIGYPASYGSDKELNDHHFHYGYFIAAAATLAKFDPAWAADDAYGGMVDLLVRDANGHDRSDPMFPYLRDFDVYAGHDWASGHGAFAAGNNQESSSEGMNFAGALIQWGEATGDTATRDAGVYLYATQAAAIQAYWFDGAGAIPEGFGHSTVGMIWGDGGAYATWFSAEPEMIQGINTLPITGSHLYLGQRPDDVRQNYAEMVAVNGGPPTVWQDIWWEYLALGDGPAALAALDAQPGYVPEEGESRAHTYHWVANLAALGPPDASVLADHPLAAVFAKDGARTYVAANVTSAPLTVTFSDGTTVDVPPGRTVASGALTWSGGSGSGGGPGPTASPTSSPTSTPTATPTSTPTAEPTSSPTPTPTPTGPAEPITLYPQPGGGLTGAAGPTTPVTLPAARGVDGVTEPSDAAVFTATGLNGTTTGGSTAFELAVDAGLSVGNGTRASVSYDLTGDGTWDRVETYRYFATDPAPGTERYTQAVGIEQATGSLGPLAGGSVRIAVWNSIGSASSTLELGPGSLVRLPFQAAGAPAGPAEPGAPGQAPAVGSPAGGPAEAAPPAAPGAQVAPGAGSPQGGAARPPANRGSSSAARPRSPAPSGDRAPGAAERDMGRSLLDAEQRPAASGAVPAPRVRAGDGAPRRSPSTTAHEPAQPAAHTLLTLSPASAADLAARRTVLMEHDSGGVRGAEPDGALVFVARGLTGSYLSTTTVFDLSAGPRVLVGNGTRVSVSYDLTGDGTWDRVEAFRYSATEPGAVERHTVGLEAEDGSLGPLDGGAVRIAVWNGLGLEPGSLDAGGAHVRLPLR